ncbi:hypothetical protein SKP52_12950 [Sphingopyxis fribergensis]|uniref:GTP cyclohydrolase I domain-containing protein n=1 Tax=Sphingopyxis fribergensis TaxID=1515612 RepID=A0A0A7PJP8_9SPHN|nr:hypothetical protein SKP52_12950 [Sphingopyxis fribergensis]
MNFVPHNRFASGEYPGERVPAPLIEARHGCMTGRGVRTKSVHMPTSRLLGCFLDDPGSRRELLALMGY